MNKKPLPKLLQYIQKIEFPHKLGICERIFGRALEKYGICWVQTAAGIEWKLNLANSNHRWIVYGVYEGTSFLNWAKRNLPPNAIVIDAGANIGQWLLYVAQLIPQGKLLAFEPGDFAATWLTECLAHNSNLPVTLIKSGVGDKAMTGHLAAAGSAVNMGAQNQISTDGTGEPISIVRLGDELRSRSIDRVDLLKMDVEGYEINALDGVREYLTDHRIRAIYSELYKEDGRKVVEYLRKVGYEFYAIRADGRAEKMTSLPDHLNGLFLPVS